MQCGGAERPQPDTAGRTRHVLAASAAHCSACNGRAAEFAQPSKGESTSHLAGLSLSARSQKLNVPAPSFPAQFSSVLSADLVSMVAVVARTSTILSSAGCQ
eukprot:7001004-Prymnesium_polylepis.1